MPAPNNHLLEIFKKLQLIRLLLYHLYEVVQYQDHTIYWHWGNLTKCIKLALEKYCIPPEYGYCMAKDLDAYCSYGKSYLTYHFPNFSKDLRPSVGVILADPLFIKLLDQLEKLQEPLKEIYTYKRNHEMNDSLAEIMVLAQEVYRIPPYMKKHFTETLKTLEELFDVTNRQECYQIQKYAVFSKISKFISSCSAK